MDVEPESSTKSLVDQSDSGDESTIGLQYIIANCVYTTFH